MELIVKSSSTTEWVLVESNNIIQQVFTEGLNPYFQTRREISRSIRLELPESFFKKKIEKVFFYGAGCSSDEKKKILSSSLISQFRTPVQVESDLLGAARGLFKNDSGIACILDTGSNSCFYNGIEIVKNVKAAGYILGDEGSSAILGKMFLSDVMKELAPEPIMRGFYQKFRITPNDIMVSAYDRPFPTRFFATVSYFLIDYINDDYVIDLLTRNIRSFFSRCVCQYDYKHYPVRFVGSVGSDYPQILRKVAREFGFDIDGIEKSSMLGLIEFHAMNQGKI
jgi:N-acetylglucosamine kinase-like BadF-type ATPase